MSISVNIPETEIQELDANVASYLKGAAGDVSKAVQETAINIEREAKLEAPVAPSGGRLRSSIRAEVRGPLSARVTVGVEYGPYLEFGTGQNVEVPTELREYARQFKGDQPAPGGGIAAQPYLFPAVFSEEPEFRKRIAKAMSKV